uniref:Rho guanine nucleotide exchange factor 6 n=1 Tax=Schistocephalus solidus TaxID=70667 RepID=A0A0V0J9X1_SCHSO
MKLPRLCKLVAYTEKIVQIISMHEWLAKFLKDMKPLDKPKFVGRLFLEVAATMDSLAGEYAKLYAYVNAGLEENRVTICSVLDSVGSDFFSKKTKSQMTSVFDRLDRYAVLLRETERYYEEPHPDRPAILKAIQVYTEIIERCALILRLKEADVQILSAEIRGLNEQPLAHFGDPALTMRVRVCTREGDSARVIIDASQPDLVLVLFQSFLFILSCTDSANVYTFRIRLLLTNLRVSVLRDNDKVLMIQWPGHHETAAEEQLLISCPDQSTRDLLNATLSDLIESTLNKASTARPAGGDSASRLQQQSVAESAPGAAIAPTTVAPVTQQIATTPSSSASSSTDKKPPPEKRTTSLHRSESSRSVGGELKSSTSGDATAAAVRPVSSGPPVSSPTHNHQHPCAAPPFTTTVAVTDVSGLPGCRFLSHSATLQAHVKWPDDIISLPSRMRSAAKGHLGPRAAVSPVQNSNSSHVLRSLRLDAASPWASLPQQQHADRLGAASAAVANSTAVVAAVDMAVGGRVSRASQQQQRSSRPGSPKPSTAAATVSAASSNIMRRRRSDRQKSAISADDILRSTGRLHELNMRAEWDSMILQVVDAYRCSFWQEMSPKPVDLAKLRLSVAELRQKESSLPPDPSRGQQRAATVAHCYENAPPEGFKLTTGEASEPIRPPPVVLPTRGERRT